MKGKNILALTLALFLVFSLTPAVAAASPDAITFWDLRNTDNVSTEKLSVTVDGKAISMTHYTAHYYSEDQPNQIVFGIDESRPAALGLRDDQRINIYVPDGATRDSAVLFILENTSWARNGFPENTLTDGTRENTEWASSGAPESTFIDGASYTTSVAGIEVPTYVEWASEIDVRNANALARNMVVVSYGCRSRGQVNAVECAATDEGAVQLGDTGVYYKPGTEYVCHSPATIVDTKAAIRFVKYNIGMGNIPGDADKVVITGHSGGGALATIIGATGNSSDYAPYLTNAAPATDDVYAVLASAPITDLPMADQAYEFTYGSYRENAPYNTEGIAAPNSKGYLTYDRPSDDLMQLSEKLSGDYAVYIEKMFGLSADEFREKMAGLLEESIQHEIDLNDEFNYDDTVKLRPETDTRGWYALDADGNVVKGSFDLDTYLPWVIANVNMNGEIPLYYGNEAKGVIAFMGMGITGGYTRNENNLFGTTAQRYSIAYEDLWDRVTDKAAIGVDQYDSWDAFWAAEGETVAMQMKMVSPMPYLMGSDAMWYLSGMDHSGDESDVAPNWFVRQGMCDCDTSTATFPALKLAIEEAAAGDTNIYFGWERDHAMGQHYLPEFYAWLDNLDPLNPRVAQCSRSITVNGRTVSPEAYCINGSTFFKLRDIAALLNGTEGQFGVEYDEAAREVLLTTGTEYSALGGELEPGADKSSACVLSDQPLKVDGESAALTAYIMGGNNFYSLQDLGALLHFHVDYRSESSQFVITFAQ